MQYHEIKNALQNENTTRAELIDLVLFLYSESVEFNEEILNEILHEILMHKNSEVVLLTYLTRCPVSSEILKEILLHKNAEWRILVFIIESRNVTLEILKEICDHPNTNNRVLETMTKSSKVKVKVTPEILEKIFNHPKAKDDIEILRCIAKSSQVTPEILTKILQLNEDIDLLADIAKSSKVTPEILTAIPLINVYYITHLGYYYNNVLKNIIQSPIATVDAWSNILVKIKNNSFGTSYHVYFDYAFLAMKEILNATNKRNQRIEAYIKLFFQTNRAYHAKRSLIYKLPKEILYYILSYTETTSCKQKKNEMFLLKYPKTIEDILLSDKYLQKIDFENFDFNEFKTIQFHDFKKNTTKHMKTYSYKNLNLIPNPMPKDGDCFYHAVRLFLPNDDNTIENLRNRVADYIADQLNNHNNEHFRAMINNLINQPLLDEIAPLVTIRTEAEYIQAVRTNGYWADNLQIIALMRVLGRPIYIIDENNNQLRNIGANIEDENVELNNPIFVLYNGHNHYNGLRIGGTSRELTKARLTIT